VEAAWLPSRKSQYASLVLFAGVEKAFLSASGRGACGQRQKRYIFTGGGIIFCHPFPIEPPQRRHLSSFYCRKAQREAGFSDSLSTLLPKLFFYEKYA
jgi:hypothetical protein